MNLSKIAFVFFHHLSRYLLYFGPPPPDSLLSLQEFRQKVMLGTPFVVIWLVGFIADLDIDSWLIKGLMYAGMWITVQFLSKYVPIFCNIYYTLRPYSSKIKKTTKLLNNGFVTRYGGFQVRISCCIDTFACSNLSLSLCRAFFDHSMHSALPLGIYLATKFWMYTTWFYWFWNDIL